MYDIFCMNYKPMSGTLQLWVMHQGIHRFQTFGTVRVMKNKSLATPLRLLVLPDLMKLFLISILPFFAHLPLSSTYEINQTWKFYNIKLK